MAVIPTGDIFKTLTLDGVSSKAYSVYITGEAVFNSPGRDVEMITIPGRNGSFALDKGRFENIEVTYPAGIAADTEAEFRDAISDFRNFLASRNGYVRLEDDYNPNEYRLAVYKSGLDVTPAQLRAGEFNIVFDCKPQRYLKSGEDAIEVDSGDVVSNPTLFASSPMLEVEGYGEIDINGAEIIISNVPIGEVQLSGAISQKYLPYSFTIDDEFANVGDIITLKKLRLEDLYFAIKSPYTGYASFDEATATNGAVYLNTGGMQQFYWEELTFVYGTAKTEMSVATVSIYTSNYGTLTVTVTMSMAYDGSNGFTFSKSYTKPAQLDGTLYPPMKLDGIQLNSTKSALGNPMYLDLEIGEAYKIENGSAVSVNNAVSIPADLPTLAPGANTVTFDNTITDLQIVPRWWKI